jgi:hypothetical protein
MSDNSAIMYILMRTDLPSMNPGKAMAQAAHASNQCVREIRKKLKDGAQKGPASPSLSDMFESWEAQTHHGFGTTIVLGATGRELGNILDKMKFSCSKNEPMCVFGEVLDPTYPISIPNSDVASLLTRDITLVKNEETGSLTALIPMVTCGYVFGVKEEVQPFLEGLSLHP